MIVLHELERIMYEVAVANCKSNLMSPTVVATNL